MVFNIASGALIYQSYKQNNTSSYITETEYILSIVEIISIILSYFIIFKMPAEIETLDGFVKYDKVLRIPLITVQIFNIIYSGLVIDYYDTEKLIDSEMNKMSLAIIILNSLCLVGIFGSTLKKKEDGYMNDSYTSRPIFTISLV